MLHAEDTSDHDKISISFVESEYAFSVSLSFIYVMSIVNSTPSHGILQCVHQISLNVEISCWSIFQTAMETVVKEGIVDGENLFVYGGSHGGFLSGHLIGQYPVSFSYNNDKKMILIDPH